MNTVYVYKYCVEYWSDCKEDVSTSIENGIVFASTFSEAVHYLEDYYGKDNIESISELKGFDISGGYVLPEWAFEEVRRGQKF